TNGETGESISYAQLREGSYRFANALKNIGARKGDIICVMLMNCPEYAIAFLGGALIGCSLSGISTQSTEGITFISIRI
uniref:AMP-dependent synthetase/ligase domain-containing protein n=1 Tax=Parascaris equorum TaxID=6256 RepID=A0A914RWU7_PAREQ